MPGKVNPVIAESLLMVCAQVIGYDAVIVWCAAAGSFELNVMMPVMAFDLLDAIELLAAGTRAFAEKLVDGLEADRQLAEGSVEQSLAMGTALTSEIGYEKTALLVNEAHGADGATQSVQNSDLELLARRFRKLLVGGVHREIG
jgi:fumarate hydratase class II